MNAPRRNLMLGTAGHVDHGKTALVKLLTGCETDTMAEEQQRGLTIDLGFAPCRLADQRVVGIIDVPGHVDFIRNMVAGAHGIDVVMLVVAADDGIMPQTHEHLHILTLMGLRHGLVALTKIDLVAPERRDEVVRHLRGLLAGTFLAQAPICPLSNITGEGFDAFFDTLNTVVATCDNRPVSGKFRVWIEDVFPIRGAGTVLTGIPMSGCVRVGDRLHLHPGNHDGRVRRLQVYGEDAPEGRAGECVALNVPELDHHAARRGMVLTLDPHATPVTMAEAELRLLDALPGTVPDYLETQLHAGTASTAAHVALLESSRMTAGQRQMVQLRLAEALPLLPGDRFVLRGNATETSRSGLTTLGGGRILGISNLRLRRRKPWTLEALRARSATLDDPAQWLAARLREAATPVTQNDLLRDTLLQPEEATACLQTLLTSGTLVRTTTEAWLHRETVNQAATSLLERVQEHHTAHPHEPGARRDTLLAAASVHPDVAEVAIASLLATGQLQATGSLLARAGWTPRVPDRDQRLAETVETRFRQTAWTPPSTEELASALHETPARIHTVLRALTDRAVLVRLDEKVWMHRDAIDAGRHTAVRLFRQQPSFSTMEFRDALGVSRKFAVPLLDHLDKLRVTVRSGHQRTPGVEARKLLDTPPSRP